jgi:hypothetical protein
VIVCGKTRDKNNGQFPQRKTVGTHASLQTMNLYLSSFLLRPRLFLNKREFPFHPREQQSSRKADLLAGGLFDKSLDEKRSQG